MREVVGRPHKLWAQGVQGWLVGRQLRLWYRRGLVLHKGQPVLAARFIDTDQGTVIRGSFRGPASTIFMFFLVLTIMSVGMVVSRSWIGVLLALPLLMLFALFGIKAAAEHADEDLRLILGLLLHATDGQPASTRTVECLAFEAKVLG
jgi:hypothetical protein